MSTSMSVDCPVATEQYTTSVVPSNNAATGNTASIRSTDSALDAHITSLSSSLENSSMQSPSSNCGSMEKTKSLSSSTADYTSDYGSLPYHSCSSNSEKTNSDKSTNSDDTDEILKSTSSSNSSCQTTKTSKQCPPIKQQLKSTTHLQNSANNATSYNTSSPFAVGNSAAKNASLSCHSNASATTATKTARNAVSAAVSSAAAFSSTLFS